MGSSQRGSGSQPSNGSQRAKSSQRGSGSQPGSDTPRARSVVSRVGRDPSGTASTRSARSRAPSIGAHSDSPDRGRNTIPFPDPSFEVLPDLPHSGDSTSAEPSRRKFPLNFSDDEVHERVGLRLNHNITGYAAQLAGATTIRDSLGRIIGPATFGRQSQDSTAEAEVQHASPQTERPFNPPTEPRAMREQRERSKIGINTRGPTAAPNTHGPGPNPFGRPPPGYVGRQSHPAPGRGAAAQPGFDGPHHAQGGVHPGLPVGIAQHVPSSHQAELYARYGAPPPPPDFSNLSTTAPNSISSFMMPRPPSTGQLAQKLNLSVAGDLNATILPGPRTSPLPPTDRTGLSFQPPPQTPPAAPWFQPPALRSALTWGPGPQARPGLLPPAPAPLGPPPPTFAPHARSPSVATSGSQYSVPTPNSYPADRSSAQGPTSRNSRPPARNRQAARYARELHRQEDLAALTVAHERLTAATMHDPMLHPTMPTSQYQPLPPTNPFVPAPAAHAAAPAPAPHEAAAFNAADPAAAFHVAGPSGARFAAANTNVAGPGTLFMGGTSHVAAPPAPRAAAPPGPSDAARARATAHTTFGSSTAIPSRQPHHTRSTPNLTPATHTHPTTHMHPTTHVNPTTHHEAYLAHRQQVLPQLRVAQRGQQAALAAAAARTQVDRTQVDRTHTAPTPSAGPSNLLHPTARTGPPAARPSACGASRPPTAPATQATTRPTMPAAPPGPAPRAPMTARAPLAPIGAERGRLRTAASSSSLAVPRSGGGGGDSNEDGEAGSTMHGAFFNDGGMMTHEASFHDRTTMMTHGASSSAHMTRRSREVLIAALQRTASENANDFGDECGSSSTQRKHDGGGNWQ